MSNKVLFENAKLDFNFKDKKCSDVKPEVKRIKGFIDSIQNLPKDGFVDDGARVVYSYYVDLDGDKKNDILIKSIFRPVEKNWFNGVSSVVQMERLNSESICVSKNCISDEKKLNLLSCDNNVYFCHDYELKKGVVRFDLENSSSWQPYNVVVGDFNNDGLMDIALCNFNKVMNDRYGYMAGALVFYQTNNEQTKNAQNRL